jgi:nicotinate-nucleotide--dimethylbenzimidazole phosphoribosyltransferase
MDISAELPPPPDFDEPAARLAEARQRGLPKPPGALGVLERVVVQLAALQGTPLPASRPAAALIFAAGHPVADHRVTRYPPGTNPDLLASFTAGGAAAAVLARMHGLPLRVVDLGLDPDAPDRSRGPDLELVQRPLDDGGLGDLLTRDAMTPALYAAAVRRGASEVDALAPDVRLLALGELGIGNTTPAAAIYAALLGGPPTVFAGDAPDCPTYVHKQALVTAAVERVRAATPDLQARPHRVVQALGGRDIAALLGAMACAIHRRIAVLIDGIVVGAAALALARLDPRWRGGMLFAHRSAEPGHQRALAELRAEPLLALGLHLGEASAALLALPLVDAACTLHAEMTTGAARPGGPG